MSEILPFLKSMISVSGLSGHEAPVAALIEKEWTPLVDQLSRSRLGSIHGLKTGVGKSPRPSVLIATHLDGIGLMVSRVVDGFLYAADIGSVDPRILPGTPVTIHASGIDGDLPGVVALPPPDLVPEGAGKGAIGLQYLLIDSGLTPREVEKRVRVGDLISFSTEPFEMSGGCVSGHTLDNRASVAALTICLQELQPRSHVWDLRALASVQEEVTYAGAYTSAYELRPTIAVVLDMTFGKGAGAGDHAAFPLGKGVTLGIGPSIHPYLHKRFHEVAERSQIPVVDEAMPAASTTDADAIQLVAEGVPTMLVSIPLRYMHTPVEVVAFKDIQLAGRLLAEFVASLDADFMAGISWD